MTEYTEVQIIKHALEYYIERPNTDSNDLKREKTLLTKYRDKAARLKERCHIRPRKELKL